MTVGDHCHISTGALINGEAKIGDNSFIGSGALVREGLKLPAGTVISAGKRVMDGTFIIAEAGVNHNGDLVMAKKLVEAAAACGADAIKFQSFSADDIVTKSAEKADYQAINDGEGSQRQMLMKLELSKSDHREIAAYCG